MCNQAFIPCTNLKCHGVAEYLALIPCNNTPNCKTTFTPIPSPKPESKQTRIQPYCPACSGMTKKERIYQNHRAAYRARKAGAPLGKGGYARDATMGDTERRREMRETRRGVMSGEEYADELRSMAEWADKLLRDLEYLF
ncbi:hypothetical protein MMC07_009962 [Pseudocyphellaria aurata]|nr:hypothetical protein [Pseudocyphellaria aurata]